MKKIENKKTSIKKDDDSFMDYSDMILLCVSQEKQGGFTIIEMKERFRIIDTINDFISGDDNGVIQMEDSDYLLLLHLIDETKWGIIHNDILSFNDYMKSLDV